MPSLPRSLPRICVALGLSSITELSRAAEREYKDGTKFLEFRLDYLPDPAAAIELIRKFREAHPDVPILATCRHKRHHGEFSGPFERQLTILEDAATAGATILDLEIETAEAAKSAVPALRASAPLMISYHNFASTPALAPVLRRLQRFEADAYKIASTARKPSDNLRLIEFVRHNRDIPLIVLAMSEIGRPTRVLAPSLGCMFTYAAPSEGEGTAPGQVSSRLMRTLYRVDKVTKQSRIYGVIADPVAHSKSPLIHNRAFQARRVDAVYLPFLVTNGRLGDWMKLAANLPVAGFSVTIPHKQRIIRYLDVLDPVAKRIGAINTVWRKAGKWRGTNTDTEGVLKPLRKHMPLAHSSVLLAGYGGAARAAAIALSDAGARVTLTGRNLRKAQALSRAVHADVMPLADAERGHFDIVINATPVGMYPNAGEMVFRETVPGDIVLDMVYNPQETCLLKRAHQQGCKIVYGSEMLLEQAACQFEIWTGESAPRAVMQSALEQNV